MRIIDAHMHYCNADWFRQIAIAAGHINTADCWEEICRENKIVFSVAMGNTMDVISRVGGIPPRLINLKASFDEVCYNQPQYIGYCLGVQSELINEKNAEATACEFEFYLKQPQSLGIKLYPGYNTVYVNDRRHWPLFELARSYHVPVVIHTGDTANSMGLLKYSHPLTVDEAAVDFPDITFVIAHCGNPWIVDAVEVASKNKNVCIDMSGLLAGRTDPLQLYERNADYFRYLRLWLSYLGQYDKILYGSDWPLVNIPVYIKVMQHVIPEKEQEKFFYTNALRVFGKINGLLEYSDNIKYKHCDAGDKFNETSEN